MQILTTICIADAGLAIISVASGSHEEAIQRWIGGAIEQSGNFGSFLNGFALVFAKLYLPQALDQLENEAEAVPVIIFSKIALPFFTLLPERGDQAPSAEK